MGDQIRQRTGQLKMRGVADIVFCFDCTYSMEYIIKTVRDGVNNFVNSFQDSLEVLDWRARAMGYRDFEVDEEYLINDKPFVTTAQDLKDQIESLEAKEDTGGDPPESTLDAIWYAAKKTEWRDQCHKIVIVFTDETSKGVDEKTLNDIPGSDDDIEVLATELEVDHIKLFLWGKRDPLYDALGKIPKADIVQLDNPEEDYKKMDFKNVLAQIGKTISQMISEDVVTK